MLTQASISGKVDNLTGLKENVIMGHLIPAGTGLQKYNQIRIDDEVSEEALLERDFAEEELAEIISKMREQVS